MNRINTTATFKEAFCAAYKCAPEAFARKILLLSFYQRALPLGLLLLAMDTPSIRQALETIDLLGQARTLLEVHIVLNDYRYQLRKPPISPLVRTFKVRLSGKRVLDLFLRLEQAIDATKPLASSETALREQPSLFGPQSISAH